MVAFLLVVLKSPPLEIFGMRQGALAKFGLQFLDPCSDGGTKRERVAVVPREQGRRETSLGKCVVHRRHRR